MKLRKLFDIRIIIKLMSIVTGIYICLRYSEECSRGIGNGIMLCVEALVPSLFLFMALSSFAVKSGAAQTIAAPFAKVSRLLFGLPPEGLSVMLLAVTGGYPVGANCAAMLYEQGRMSKEEARKSACIAVCAGPGFLVNYVGNALLHDKRAGTLLLAAEIAGMLITGMVTGKLLPASPPRGRIDRRHGKSKDLLLSSVTDASSAVFRMCGVVVICAALTEVVASISPYKELTDIISALIEITTGCSRLCGSYPIFITAFFIGFGGLSVHLQIFAAAEKPDINKLLFFLFRIIQGIITAAAAYILFMIFPLEQSVFSSVDAPLTLDKSAAIAGSAALVLSCLCFLGSIDRLKAKKSVEIAAG